MFDLFQETTQFAPDQLGAFLADHARRVGLADLTIYLIDYEQLHLVPIEGSDSSESVAVEGTVAGRAFRTGQQIEVAGDDGVRLWSAVVDGAARLGVLGATIGEVDDGIRGLVANLASVTAAFLITRGLCTDAYIKRRRSRPITLAAEMQWQLLPPLAMHSPRVSLAGLVEPAYEVGGDAFDYALNGDNVDFAVFDAMGHGLGSSQLAHLAVTSFRHSRRSGYDLADTCTAMDEVVAAEGGGERFVTCLMGRLNLADGHLAWLTAGHPRPLLLRGGRIVGSLPCEPTLPLGFGGAVAEIAEGGLEPGDRLFCFTDGMVEAHGVGEEPFGEARLADLLDRETLAGFDVAETARRLIQAVLAHHAYRLGDDATLFLLERTAT